MKDREETRSGTEDVTLPIHCAHCHGAVTLQMVEWPDDSHLEPGRDYQTMIRNLRRLLWKDGLRFEVAAPIMLRKAGVSRLAWKAGETSVPGPLNQRWECPYCRKGNVGEFPWRLAWVRKGHKPEPTA